MAATTPRLWLVRHARPLLESGICYGSLDVPADPAATAQAARALASALPTGARVHSSPLQRCEQLALATCALRPDLILALDPRLREMDFGAWEGRAWNDIPRQEIDAWAARFDVYRPGQGDNVPAILARVRAAWRATQARAMLEAGRDMVWITHAGVARCVAWLQERGESALPRSEDWPVAAPGLGEWEIRELT